METHRQSALRAEANGFGMPKWSITESDKLKRTVKQANHMNANGGNGRYGVDQSWANSLNMPQQEKQSVLSGLRS